ncbi:MAG: phospholipase D-like domain-containing protein [Candidatus Acidiferrales bacterium]
MAFAPPAKLPPLLRTIQRFRRCSAQLPSFSRLKRAIKSLQSDRADARFRSTNVRSPGYPEVSLVKSPWQDRFLQLVSTAQRELLLVSPFIKSRPTEQIVSSLQRRGLDRDVRITVLTNLRPESALNGSMDLEALVNLSKEIPRVELTHMPSLHAKVYVADERIAIVTSANLTQPGVSGNLEYGIAFTDVRTVRQVRADFENYSLLGAKVSSSDVEALLNETKELKILFRQAEYSIKKEARRAFQRKLQTAHNQLLHHRAKGKTTQAMLSDAILFLLARAPLSTTELQPLVQQLQPDLCDDSIDRVIDGVHFGRRWKHHVRSAQQALKHRGAISYDGGRWRLGNQVPGGENWNTGSS